MRRWALVGALVWIALAAGALTASPASAPAAEREEPPFELPIDETWSQLIPDGLGMKFFHGKWDYLDRGGSFPVEVTAEALVNLAAPKDAPHRTRVYRVLHEARNYVLIAELMRGTKRTWTDFVVLTLRRRESEDPYSVYAPMIEFSCGLPFMKDSAQAFRWPREKLMELFRSQCPVEVNLQDRSSLGEGWSRFYYQRRED